VWKDGEGHTGAPAEALNSVPKLLADIGKLRIIGRIIAKW
jgi:hypothetical protein